MAESVLTPKIREFLEKKGLDTTYAQAKNEFFRTYRIPLPQSSFHNRRNEMRKEAAKRTASTAPSLVAPAPKPANPLSGVAELVRTAKKLVDLLGKEASKELIDSL